MRLFLTCMVMLGSWQGSTEVGLAQLEAEPSRYDGTVVSITGEIVGDYGIRADVVWFQLNDDPYAITPLEEGELRGQNSGIGVRIARGSFDESWGEPGGYRVRGPLVKITGTFRHNEPVSGGETFIEASAVELIEPSRPIEAVSRSSTPAFIGGALLLAAAVLLVVARTRRVLP